jgi:hypothetical protein
MLSNVCFYWLEIKFYEFRWVLQNLFFVHVYCWILFAVKPRTRTLSRYIIYERPENEKWWKDCVWLQIEKLCRKRDIKRTLISARPLRIDSLWDKKRKHFLLIDLHFILWKSMLRNSWIILRLSSSTAVRRNDVCKS